MLPVRRILDGLVAGHSSSEANVWSESSTDGREADRRAGVSRIARRLVTEGLPSKIRAGVAGVNAGSRASFSVSPNGR